MGKHSARADIVYIFVLIFFFGPVIFMAKTLFNTSLEIQRVLVLTFLLLVILLRAEPILVSRRFLFVLGIYFVSVLVSVNMESAVPYALVVPIFFFVAENLVCSISLKIGRERALNIICLIMLLTQGIVLLPMLFIDGISVLNFYTSQNLEEFGLRSNYVGWSCAIIVPILFLFNEAKLSFWIRALTVVCLLWCLILVIGSGSRAGALSIILCSGMFLLRNFRRHYWIVLVIVGCGIYGYFQIIESSKFEEVSFVERQERIRKGIANDDYRRTVYSMVLSDITQLDDSRVFTGYGANNFREYMRLKDAPFARYNLSSHSTYVELFVSFGLVGCIIILMLFIVKPIIVAFKLKLLYVITPVIVISMFENNLGPGQFLFATFMVYSILFYPNDRAHRTRSAIS